MVIHAIISFRWCTHQIQHLRKVWREREGGRQGDREMEDKRPDRLNKTHSINEKKLRFTKDASPNLIGEGGH